MASVKVSCVVCGKVLRGRKGVYGIYLTRWHKNPEGGICRGRFADGHQEVKK